MHLGKPDAETLSCIVSGVYWGYVCYRGGSYWPAVIMHTAVNYVNLALISGYL
jgi:membrane protease YdiL (CAAX protease family)